MSPGNFEIPVTDQEVADLRHFLEVLNETLDSFAALELPHPPPPGSPMAGDDRHMGGYPVSLFTHASMVASAENLASLRDLLVRSETNKRVDIGVRGFGPFAVIRAAMESAAQVCWVLSPPSRWERLARRWALRLDELRNQGEAMEDMMRGASGHASTQFFGPDVDKDTLEHEAEKSREKLAANQRRIRQLVDDAPDALTWTKVKNTKDRARWIHIFADLEAANPQLEQFRLRYGWRVCAALSHSKEWAHLSTLDLHPLKANPETASTEYAVGVNYSALATYGHMAVRLLDYAVQLHDQRTTPHRAR